VWEAIKSCNVKVETFERSHWSGREKKVDAKIISDAVEAASDAFYARTSSEFVIVSGDSDIQMAVEKIAKRGFVVHVWSWENCLSNDYKYHANELVHVHLLDPYLEQIGFHNNKWRGEKKNIPLHSAVVLDAAPKAEEINEFTSRLHHPFRRYELDEIRDGASSHDLVIIHALASSSAMDYDAREHFFQLCKRGLSKHGLTVLTYQEYAQEYPNSTAKLAISNRFQELPDGASGDEVYTPTTDADGANSEAGSTLGLNTTGYQVVDRSTTKQKEWFKRSEIRSQKRCDRRKYCARELDCGFGHTEEERKQFQAYGHLKAKKVKLCKWMEACTRGYRCHFAHGAGELFCPTCEMTGAHDMVDCPDRANNIYKN
jgi:hypothetical protein